MLKNQYCDKHIIEFVHFFHIKKGLFKQYVCKFQQKIIQGVQKIGLKINFILFFNLPAIQVLFEIIIVSHHQLTLNKR